MRTLPLLLLAACAPGVLEVDGLDDRPDAGWATDPIEGWSSPATEEDPYAGAVLEIRSPSAGEILNWGQVNTFEAVITAADGSELEAPVEWGSDSDPNWYETGAWFETEDLPLGIHNFTATATLPDGATLQHTVGGVRVQHVYAGTYVGLLDVDGTVLNFPISCVGSGLIVIEKAGEEGTGDADCLVSLLGLDVPLHMLYELDFDADGTVSGTVGVDLIGFFTYNFPASGGLDPQANLEVSFEGEVPGMGPLSGLTTAERISFDTE